MPIEKEETPMSMGRRRATQPSLWVGHEERQRSPGHRFYETLGELLHEANFDRQVEALCAPSHRAGRRSTTPGTYFRRHLIGYFEGIESERGRKWLCCDSLSLRAFPGLERTERVPDHSTLSRLRQRLPLAVHEQAFGLNLAVVRDHGWLAGRVLGVDSTYLRADASMKAIVRPDTKESYAPFVGRLAEEAGIENPSAAEAQALDRKRKGKTTSNAEWTSATDADARIAKLKDGHTRLAYKPEHVVDLETGALTGVVVHLADRGDTETLVESLSAAQEDLRRVAPAQGGGDAPRIPTPPQARSGTIRRPRLRPWWPTRGITRRRCCGSSRSEAIAPTCRSDARRDAAAGPPKAAGPPRRRSTRTGRELDEPRASAFSENGASCWNEPSRISVRPAGCDAPGCAGERTSANATCCVRRRPTWG
jgi:hypothetical protein